MKLLVVSQYFWPENFRVNDLVADLVRRGHEVTVLTGRPNYPDGKIFRAYLDDAKHYSTYEGAEIVRVPMMARGSGSLRLVANYASFALSASTVGLARLWRRPFDAIFVFEPSPITVGLPALALKWHSGAPIAFWVLDLWPQSVAAVGALRSEFMLGLIRRLVKFIYRGSDLILAQSRSFMDDIVTYLPSPDRIRYFPSWSDQAPQADIVEVGVPPAEGRFSIMFAGNIGAAQDFPAILDAADLLRDKPIRWLIVGDGRQANWVRSETARRNLGQSVIMLGRHPLGHMPSFYRHADALLVSLRAEPIFALTIPGKLQAYLDAGIPILAMLDGEGAAVVREAEAGFTASAGNARELADAVERLRALPADYRASMGRKGRGYAQREFNRDSLIGQLEDWLIALSQNSKGEKS